MHSVRRAKKMRSILCWVVQQLYYYLQSTTYHVTLIEVLLPDFLGWWFNIITKPQDEEGRGRDNGCEKPIVEFTLSGTFPPTSIRIVVEQPLFCARRRNSPGPHVKMLQQVGSSGKLTNFCIFQSRGGKSLKINKSKELISLNQIMWLRWYSFHL